MPNTTSHGATAPVIDRNTASDFNPLIGIHAEETMERCNDAIMNLAYVISGAAQMGLELNVKNMFRLFETSSIALRFEIKALQNQSAGKEIERRNQDQVGSNPATIRAAISELNSAITTLSRQPETDTAATAALIHVTTSRAFLRDMLAEVESGVAK